jgi:ankyrin repeat protein
LNSSRELASAFLSKDYETAFSLIQKGEDVNTRELTEYKSFVHFLCKQGDLDTLKRLMKYEPDIEALDYDLATPLFEAAFAEQFEILEFLIEDLKVNILHKEKRKRNILNAVACDASVKLVDYLLSKRDIDRNGQSGMGRTPLIKAIWNHRLDVVERLLQDKKVNVNTQDKNGKAPIHAALWYNDKPVNQIADSEKSINYLKALIKAGADLEAEDKPGYTPLLLACANGTDDVLNFLIDQGCNPHHLNKEKANCLIEATRFNCIECIKVLLKRVPDLNLDLKDMYELSAIEYSVALDYPNNFKLFTQFKNFNDDELLNLLNVCIFSNSTKCFKLIIDILNKSEFFVRHSHSIFSEILERIINLCHFKLFNMLFDEYSNYVSLMLSNNTQYICKLLLLSEQYIKEDEDIKKNEQNDLDPEKEKDNKAAFDTFKENCQKLLEMLIGKFKKKKQLSVVFIKTLILLNKVDILRNIIDEEITYIEDKFEIKSEYYKKFKIRSLRKKDISVLQLWKETLDNINYHNIISMSLSKPEDHYLDIFMDIKFFNKHFFEKLSDNKNLLHLLFEAQNFPRFKILLTFIEKHYTNQIDLIIHMFDQHDNN